MNELLLILLAIAFFVAVYKIITRTISKTDPKFKSYYDFSGYFPLSSKWSIIFYLLIILVLVGIFILVAKTYFL
ncbi:MAG: hypothetical protein AAB685_01910 [Patescibacteria group bacterium]